MIDTESLRPLFSTSGRGIRRLECSRETLAIASAHLPVVHITSERTNIELNRLFDHYILPNGSVPLNNIRIHYDDGTCELVSVLR